MRDQSTQYALLIRPQSGQDPTARVRFLLTEQFGAAQALKLLSRIEIVSGDVTLENFGLGRESFVQLASRTTAMYHAAANTELGQPLSTARAINVAGTAQVLELARLAARHDRGFRLHHISTAYVAGDTDQIVEPDDLDLNRAFKNGYEQSKAEAEALVRSFFHVIPTTIYRPSVVVGDSVTGRTSTFNVVYVPARMLASGMFKALPARANVPFDIVPIDYVADALVALSEKVREGCRSFHLCAGVGRETSPGEVLNFIIEIANSYRKRGLSLLQSPPLIALDFLTLAQLSFSAARESVKYLERFFHGRIVMFQRALPFVLYMNRNPRFDTTDTVQMLEGILPPAPLFSNYAERLFRYCLDTDWGRRPWANPENLLDWVGRSPGPMNQPV